MLSYIRVSSTYTTEGAGRRVASNSIRLLRMVMEVSSFVVTRGLSQLQKAIFK